MGRQIVQSNWPLGVLPVLGACVIVASCFRMGLDVERATLDSGDDGSADSDGEHIEGRWVELGGSAVDNGLVGYSTNVRNIRLVADTNGMPAVLWTDAHTGNYEVYFRRWDGTAWRGLGGSEQDGGLSQSSGESRPGSLELDESGNPWITWMERGDGFGGIYLLSWTGSEWREIGGSVSGQGISQEGNVWWPDLVFDENMNPVVAWEVYNVAPTSSLLYLKRWDGLQWSEVNGSASPPGLAADGAGAWLINLVSGQDGELHAVWLERTTEDLNLVAHRFFDGISWASLDGTQGAISTPGEDTFGPHVVILPDGAPVVCYQINLADRHAVGVKRWDGVRWSDLGDVTSGRDINDPRHPNIAVDSDGRPIVAFAAADPLGTNVYLSVWTGATWEPAYDTDVEGGLSTSSVESQWPRVVWGVEGPIVVWEELAADNETLLYLKAWRRD